MEPTNCYKICAFIDICLFYFLSALEIIAAKYLVLSEIKPWENTVKTEMMMTKTENDIRIQNIGHDLEVAKEVEMIVIN